MTTSASAGRPNASAERRWFGGARVVDVTCDCCGASFAKYRSKVLRSKRHYCGPECQRTHRTGEVNPHWKGGDVRRSCQHCGKVFGVCQAEAKRKGFFCSTHCKASDQIGRARA